MSNTRNAPSPGDPRSQDWFLPDAGRPTVDGNLVTPLVHGATYFGRLHEVVSATRSGDRVFFTDWRGDADERLLPDGPTVAELLCAAARRGVEVRGLLWRSHSDRVTFSAQENEHLGKLLNEAGGEALLDERVRRGGSHHQKLVAVQHPDNPTEDVAFVGGIDLSHGRRDDGAHRGDPQQQPMDPRYGTRAPWHDVTLEIRGPAVHQVVETFTERWNDPTPLDHRNPVRWALQRAARMPKRPMPLPSPLPAAPAAGPHSVQLLRTYAAKRPPYPFAPGGERTVARGLLHAFARARRYIYIEDQYLWSALVAAPLAAALRNTPDLHLIAVVPRYPDDDGRLTGPPNRLGQLAAIHALLDAAPERVGVFDLENAAGTPIYVHAKVCVVDDVWMSCGSSNLNRRSWTHDSEATCAVVGADLPGRLRTTLWAEHLGLPAEDPRLHDPAGGLAIWRERASALDEWHAGGRRGERPPGRVRCHRPDPVPRRQRWWVVPAYHLVHDPDGRPTSWRLGNRW